MSAETPLPLPGDQLGDLTVRASGALPVDGRTFVVTRHSARQQVRALGQAEALARTDLSLDDGAAVSPSAAAFYAAALLISQAVRLRDGDNWVSVKLDDLLDMDADDFDTLNKAADEPPGPRSPTS